MVELDALSTQKVQAYRIEFGCCFFFLVAVFGSDRDIQMHFQFTKTSILSFPICLAVVFFFVVNHLMIF